MSHEKLGWMLLGSVAAFGLAACGGGGGGSKATGFTSVEALAGALEAPSGTVEPATAVGVAEEFQKNLSSGFSGGIRQKELAQSATIDCPNGGSITASGDQTQVHATYNACAQSGCVINGSLDTFITASGEWSQCLSYNINAVCDDQGTLSLQYSGCLNGEGTLTYLVEYEGETYSVSGSYSNGSGTLTITGENGSWTCTYTENAGTCTGSDGDSFEFTADSGSEDDETDEG